MHGRLLAASPDQGETHTDWDDADERYREACNYLYEGADLFDEGGEEYHAE